MENDFTDFTGFYPSADGNAQQRAEFLAQITKLVSGLDAMKDPHSLTLGEADCNNPDFYNHLIASAQIPTKGYSLDTTITKLLDLSKGQRYVNSSYVANAAPLPTTSSILGNLLMTLLNGNNVWDVEGSASASAEVQLTSALSKIVGYDHNESAGYTTWGGQGAVFNSLRIAISRRFPNANAEGVPNNLYAFCSELSHYSLYKSVEATGIGTNHLVKVKANADGSMDITDLQSKILKVIKQGGTPLYVLATMGSTDSFSVDNLLGIKTILVDIEDKYHLEPIYLHADTAMGGFFTFFNGYDTETNNLAFSNDVVEVIQHYQNRFKHIHIADSMVFDSHKLGQTPYATSLFLLKDKHNLQYVDLDPDETPYLGNRGFGSYHTSYTLECSRAGSAIPILASLTNLGVEGYQRILANYLKVNIEFRKALKEAFPNVAITNHVSPVTTFRFYNTETEELDWNKELYGHATKQQIEETNAYNSEIAELLGVHRDEVYFGSTSKQCLVKPSDDQTELPVYVHKFFSISPYTTLDEIPMYIDFLKKHQVTKVLTHH